MPKDAQDQKWSCFPCIQGHRTGKCRHFERWMVRVRRPGRPLRNCQHPRSTCDCTEYRYKMVEIKYDPEVGPQSSVCVAVYCEPILPSESEAPSHEEIEWQLSHPPPLPADIPQAAPARQAPPASNTNNGFAQQTQSPMHSHKSSEMSDMLQMPQMNLTQQQAAQFLPQMGPHFSVFPTQPLPIMNVAPCNPQQHQHLERDMKREEQEVCCLPQKCQCPEGHCHCLDCASHPWNEARWHKIRETLSHLYPGDVHALTKEQAESFMNNMSFTGSPEDYGSPSASSTLNPGSLTMSSPSGMDAILDDELFSPQNCCYPTPMGEVFPNPLNPAAVNYFNGMENGHGHFNAYGPEMQGKGKNVPY